ncbi:uncharacterized protein VDAG_03731 [Verticillium dahliae VdLs.17]|uniref:Integral membrane protein n=1 Tax=Verticillium dahliae (strain VdLs.17 / ATCC MYA-4575 / FGSC 10137) TaxID=498257 RepID=G2X0F2_VERDV|nr:uncharacterized protein VDAG_03731 [Verticillium dahliae VdLs.17]EGY22293.1 hypothetical protein VDAG_03731 [Verticillium dahliae VdLs.17]KAH6704690.1 hypothetical protein EV126DRAFT_440420 [Verticillium dahliae]
MITLLPSHFVLEEVTGYDLAIASLAWGFTLGIGWLTTWTAMKQTTQVYRRHGLGIFYNAYVWMIWGDIFVCLAFVSPSISAFVQFLLQIIINRCSILLTDKAHAWRIKISERYIEINEWWDRCEKILYLIVDAALNVYFMIIVQRILVEHGLRKYRNLVKFNMFIIGFSLSMDVLIICMMSLKNTFVYMQFHPLAYIVKLNIEMSMAELIAKIAKSKDNQGPSEGYSHSRSHGTQRNRTVNGPTWVEAGRDGKGSAWGTVTTTLEMHTTKAPAGGDQVKAAFNHGDIDRLTNAATPYIGYFGTSQGDSQGGSYRGGSGSLSSLDSTNVGAVAERNESERGGELP